MPHFARRLCACVATCLLVVVVGSAMAFAEGVAPGAAQGVAQGAAPLPWKYADALPGGATVEGIQRSAEHVRLQVKLPDGGAVTLEVRYSGGQEGPYDTGMYAVQPGPGVDAPDGGPVESLVRALAKELEAIQQQPGHRPFVQKLAHRATADPNAPPPRPPPDAASTWSTPSDHGWGRHAGWLLLQALVLALAAWLGGWRVGLPLLGGLLLFMLLGALDGVAIGRINSLQEGGTGPRIEQLYGHGIHAGGAFVAVSHALTGGTGYGIAELARGHVAMWAVASGLFAGFALQRAGLLAGSALAILAALNGITLNAATSELPSMFIALHVALAALLCAQQLEGSRDKARIVAVAGCGLLIAGARAELMVLLPLAALSLALVRLPRWHFPAVAWRTGWEILSWQQRWGVVAALVLLAAFVVTPLLAWAVADSCVDHWCYFARAMGGEDLLTSLVWLPGFLLGTAMPLGFGVLWALVVLRVLVKPWAALGLGVGVLVLYRVYYIAGHGMTLEHYELYRYLTMLVLPALILCTEAVRWLMQSPLWARVSGQRRQLAAGAWLLTMVVFPGAGSAYDAPWPQAMARNQQREVRALLTWTRQHPRCALVAVVGRDGMPSTHGDRDGSGAPGHGSRAQPELALFGGEQSGVNPARYSLESTAALQKDLAHLDCRLLYWGADCAVMTDVCQRFAQGPPLAADVAPSARFLADHFTRPPADGDLPLRLHRLQLGRAR